MIDLASELPRLLPKAISWAEIRAAEVAAHGGRLTEQEQRLAQIVGVEHPERICITEVVSLPFP